MPREVVSIQGGKIRLPDSLDELLGHPTRLRIIESDTGCSIAAHGTLARLRDLLGQIYPVAPRDGEVFDSPVPLDDGQYGVAAYPPVYSLLPLDADHREGRQKFWESIDDYHEHRPPDEQDEQAQEATGLFVREALVPTGGSSFLEIGCGAGRNLVALAEALPDAALHGIDANPHAVQMASEFADAQQGSLYDLSRYPDGSVDVVFTAGVLMHVPHEDVEGVIAECVRIARVATVHSEIHGEPHPFDFHRYARDYGALYRALGLEADYTVFPAGDRRGDPTGPRALLVYSK